MRPTPHGLAEALGVRLPDGGYFDESHKARREAYVYVNALQSPLHARKGFMAPCDGDRRGLIPEQSLNVLNGG